MAHVFIAFIECVLGGYNWQLQEKLDNDRVLIYAQGVYKCDKDKSEISLIDLGGTRRYYSFNSKSVIRIANNTLIYKEDDADLITINESEQFKEQKRIDK